MSHKYCTPAIRGGPIVELSRDLAMNSNFCSALLANPLNKLETKSAQSILVKDSNLCNFPTVISSPKVQEIQSASS